MLKRIKIGAKEVYPVILGTSPFYSFRQFGEENARRYGYKFRDKESITEIIVSSIKNGVDCIQTVSPEIVYEPYYSRISYGIPPLIEAIEAAEKRMKRRIASVSTIISERSLKMMNGLENVALLIDGNVTDNTQEYGVSHNNTLNIPKLLNLKKAILKTDSVFGIVTHCPGTTIPKLIENEEFFDSLDVVMMPINKIGYRVQPKWNESCVKALEMLKNLGVTILGMKILASGRIPPVEALRYIESLNFLDGVVLGISSVEEAEKTLRIAQEICVREDVTG